jgi:pyruvyltransferase
VTAPIRAYWWNETPNFGDRLSQHVIARMSGRPVQHARPLRATIFGIGSIMGSVRRAGLADRPGERPWVWGTGMIAPMHADFVANVRFCAVRGPLTVDFLGIDPATPTGDPGLFACELIDGQTEPTDRIGLVLHHSQDLPQDLAARLAKDGRFVRISVGEPDCLDVVRLIAACRHVMSSSLHGLIVADSVGVPSTWLQGYGIHKSPTFKFYDYALSVGRDLGRPRPLDAIFEIANDLPRVAGALPHEHGVARQAARLRAAFPQELVA